MSDNELLAELTRAPYEGGEPTERRPDGAGFDPALVPDGELGELFRHGDDGRGLSDEEYDELRRRLREQGADPFAK